VCVCVCVCVYVCVCEPVCHERKRERHQFQRECTFVLKFSPNERLEEGNHQMLMFEYTQHCANHRSGHHLFGLDGGQERSCHQELPLHQNLHDTRKLLVRESAHREAVRVRSASDSTERATSERVGSRSSNATHTVCRFSRRAGSKEYTGSVSAISAVVGDNVLREERE
jgi:predicted ATPase